MLICEKQALSIFGVAALLLNPSPLHALTCESESVTHIKTNERKKYKSAGKLRKATNQTLQAFYPFVDSVDIFASKISKATLTLGSLEYECSTRWDVIQADCGDVTLVGPLYPTGGTDPSYKGKIIGPPLNKPWPFEYAVINKQNYALISRYALNQHFNAWRYNTGEDWVFPANIDSIKQCASWKEIKGDEVFSHLVRSPFGRYINGKFVCIENVACKRDLSTTTLSVSMSLVPTKYLETIASISSKYRSSLTRKEQWHEFLRKINPLLSQPDIKSAKFTIVIETPLKPYSSEL